MQLAAGEDRQSGCAGHIGRVAGKVEGRRGVELRQPGLTELEDGETVMWFVAPAVTREDQMATQAPIVAVT